MRSQVARLAPGQSLMDETDIRQLLTDGRQREAFELIMDRFQEKVFHLALSMTRHEATARDLAQEALLRVWKALPAYNGSASLSTWIYTITRNVCLTELTRAARRPTVPLDAPESAALLGQPLGTVKTNLFRARKELARLAFLNEGLTTGAQIIRA